MLERLHAATGQFEVSFASKLAATIDPNLPLIDSLVLRNLGLKLPQPSLPLASRVAAAARLHREILQSYTAFLGTAQGRSTLKAFKAKFPQPEITDVKALDLMIWQSRDDTKRPAGPRWTPQNRQLVDSPKPTINGVGRDW